MDAGLTIIFRQQNKIYMLYEFAVLQAKKKQLVSIDFSQIRIKYQIKFNVLSLLFIDTIMNEAVITYLTKLYYTDKFIYLFLLCDANNFNEK